MAGLYDKGREGFLDGSIDWDTDTIKCILLSAGYVANLATHQFLSDVAAGSRVGTGQTLGSKTVTAGVADAADVTFTAVSGAAVTAILLWKDTGTEATSRLVAYVDGVGVTPNGGNITVTWDNGANKIFKL
jgi:hypothetical protein